ncbi:MAG TPA: O-antigen ligase family protein [Caulifigura sp.]|jgi:hypothetical protein|nr:O-antigen ligase family protein [Caulifigura sp.]
MEGRYPKLAGGQTAAVRTEITGVPIAPFLVIPFIVQADICAARLEWTQQSPLGMGLGLLVAMALMAIVLKRREVARVFRESQLVLFGFFLLATIAIAGSLLPDACFDEGGKYISYPSIFAILFALTLTGSSLFVGEIAWRLAIAIAMCLLVASIAADAVSPGTFSAVPNRAAGFGINPNTGGALVALMTLGLLNWKKAGFSVAALLTMAVSGIGVFLTLSRSGLLTWGAINAYYVYCSMRARGAQTWIVTGAGCMFLVGYAATASEWAREAIPMLGASHQRIETFLGGGGGGMDHADDSRIELAQEFFHMAMESPWTGWGTGLMYSFEEGGAHNIYLSKWVENGIGAMLTLVGMIYATFRVGRRHQDPACVAMAGFLFIQGFFSHNLMEDKAVMMMWALVLGRASLSRPVVAPTVNRVKTASRPVMRPRLAEAA